MKRATLLSQQNWQHPRRLLWRLRVGSYGSGKILLELEQSDYTREQAIAAARDYGAEHGYAIVINEAWLGRAK